MVQAARLVSNVFHPAYYPLVCLGILFFTTFLEYMGLANIIIILCLTALFTIFFPSLLVYLHRTIYRISLHRMQHRHERFVPYTIHLLCYFLLLHILQRTNVHGLVLDVIIVSILIQICCTLVNCFWKVSMHAAGAGGIMGFLIFHGTLFGIGPIIPLIISILICGLVGTSRLILRRHTLAQVNVGSLIGILCGIAGTMLTNYRIILG